MLGVGVRVGVGEFEWAKVSVLSHRRGFFVRQSCTEGFWIWCEGVDLKRPDKVVFVAVR